MALPARVIKALVGHFRQANKLQEVERMILHLNPREMDLDSLVKLCRANQLHDALIYIFNRGMLDYVTPLEDLLGRPLTLDETPEQAVRHDSDQHVKALLYVH